MNKVSQSHNYMNKFHFQQSKRSLTDHPGSRIMIKMISFVSIGNQPKLVSLELKLLQHVQRHEQSLTPRQLESESFEWLHRQHSDHARHH